MIDWTNVIISVLSGVSLAGVFGSIFFYRENKKKAKAEAAQALSSAKKEDASAATELLGVLTGTKEFMEEINAYSKEATRQLLLTVQEKDKQIAELSKKVNEMSVLLNEQQRKIEGLQRTVKQEISLRKESDKWKCTVEDCNLRQPPRRKETA